MANPPTMATTEDMCRLIADSLPVLVAYIDKEQRYRFVNKRYGEWFGNTESIPGLTILELVGEAVHAQVDPYIKGVLNGEPQVFERELVFRDGQRRFVRATYMPDADADVGVRGWVAMLEDITESRRIEQALSQSEQHLRANELRFRLALRNSQISVFEQDEQLRYTWAHNEDPQFAPELLIGKTDREMNPGQWTAELSEVKRRIMRTGAGERHEVQIPVNGQDRVYEMNLEPLRDSDGRVSGVIGAAVNVTAAKQSERNLRESELRYRREQERLAQVFEQSPVGIAVLSGEDFVFEMANPPYREFLPNRQLVGRPLLEAIPELDPVVPEILTNVLRKGEPFRAHEFYLPLDRDRDGVVEDCWWDLLYHPVVESDGSIRSIIVVATDATVRVLGNKELKEQWRTFDAALSNTPDYVYIFNRDGRFEYANRPFAELLHRPLEEIVGRRLIEVGYPAELAAKLTLQIHTVFEKTETIVDETDFTSADGQTRRFEYILVPIANDAGVVRAVAGSGHDITDRLRSVERLRRSNEELTRMNRELEEFAFVASHDLQEPLRMVSIYTQMLLRNLPAKDGKLSEYATFVRDGVSRMEALIKDLLSFSRTVQLSENLLEPVDLNRTLQQAIALLKQQIDDSCAQFQIQPLPTVYGESSQLIHVFQNLLSNSLKYKSTATNPIIEIASDNVDGACRVMVRDNGIGFEQRYAQRIFGLFKRLHKDEYPGTGLGLAICQRVIERYGGKMWAEGHPGEGATFYFQLQRCIPPHSDPN